jgi:hypothetical protein
MPFTSPPNVGQGFAQITGCGLTSVRADPAFASVSGQGFAPVKGPVFASVSGQCLAPVDGPVFASTAIGGSAILEDRRGMVVL